MENKRIAIVALAALVLLFGCIGGSGQGDGYGSNIVSGGDAQSTPVGGGGSTTRVMGAGNVAAGASGQGTAEDGVASASGITGATVSGGAGASGTDPVKLSVTGDSIAIPLNQIGTRAKFYSATSGFGSARFFVVKDSSEKVHVALDACDVCGGRKGYRQEGEAMVCNNCGQSFRIVDIGVKNKVGGGCWPSYLAYSESGNDLIIKKSDLDSVAYRFN